MGEARDGEGWLTAPLADTQFLTGKGSPIPDIEWLTETGVAMTDAAWNDPGRQRLAMILGPVAGEQTRAAVLINGDRRATSFALPERDGFVWQDSVRRTPVPGGLMVDGRTVAFAREGPA